MQIHATPFFWATLALFILTVVFYVVCISLLYYWHEKRTTFVIIPLLYTFEFFVIGFFVVSLLTLVLQYLPSILTLTSS